jgi:ribosomal protein L7/L12
MDNQHINSALRNVLHHANRLTEELKSKGDGYSVAMQNATRVTDLLGDLVKATSPQGEGDLFTAEELQEIRQALKEGRKAIAVNIVRNKLGLGLREAYHYVENHFK